MKNMYDFNEYLFESNTSVSADVLISKRLFDLLNEINHPIAVELARFYNYEISSDKATLIDYDDNNKGNFTYILPSKFYEYVKKTKLSNFDITKKYNIKYVSSTLPDAWKINRTSTSIGKLINKLFPKKYKPSGEPGRDIESFTNEVKNLRTKHEESFKRFKIVEGEDIKKYYLEDNYDPRAFRGSTLGHSCMRHEECQDYIEFYAKNDGVKLVILMSDDLEQSDKIMGRAVLWDIEWIDGVEVDRKFMDRIYTIYDSDVLLYKEFAEKNGWLYKKNQTMNNNEYIVDGKTNEISHLTMVTTKNFNENDYYPYIDTMKYFYNVDGYLSNQKGSNDGSVYFLEETDGGFEEINGIYVEYYDTYYDEEDLTYCEFGDEYRLPNDAIYCEHYNEYATESYAENNMNYSERDDTYYLNEDCVYSEYYEDYINSDDSVEVYEKGASDVDDPDELSKYNTDYRSYDDDDMIRYKDTDMYFHEDDYYNFIDVYTDLSSNSTTNAHKIWDKDNIFKYKGKMYINIKQEDKDKLTGQKRIW